jgi:hypothetical protein
MQKRIESIVGITQMAPNDEWNVLAVVMGQMARALPEVAAKRAKLRSLKLFVCGKKLCDIGAGLQDRLIGFTNHQQRAMRLNGAREVDLLPFTVR